MGDKSLLLIGAGIYPALKSAATLNLSPLTCFFKKEPKMKTKLILSLLFLLAIAFTLFPNPCLSAVPSLINYQGVLKNAEGVPQNGEFAMKFCIYNDSTGGDSLWCEINMAVQVKNGLFNVLLGSVTPIPDSVFYQPNRWLQVQVGGSVLSPRRRIVSVGYAFTDADWTMDGDNIYREQGNVGIGTTTPSVKLEVQSVGCQECTVLKIGNYTAEGRQYLQIDVENWDPPASACDEGSEVGRMVMRGDTNQLFICTGYPTIGWKHLTGQ
jgi:hypothetical protein